MMKSRNKEIQIFVRARGPYEAPIPVNILYPVSRDNAVHSLLHLTRSTIRKRVRLDHIDYLTIPTHLKEYLKDSQYLYEQTDSALPVIDITQAPPLPPPTKPPPLPPRRINKS